MFDISKLNNETSKILEIDEVLKFSEEDLKHTDIKRLENIRAKGTIERIDSEVYHLVLVITGNMVLPCARSLEDVNYPIHIILDKNIGKIAEEGENQVILQNSLDIFSIVWENIVLEVPLRVICENASFLNEGNGWSLKDDFEEASNLPFSELGDMLDMEGKR